MERNQLKKMYQHKLDQEPTLTTLETAFNHIHSKTLLNHALTVVVHAGTIDIAAFFEFLNKKMEREVIFLAKICKKSFSNFISRTAIPNTAFDHALKFYRIVGVERGDYNISFNNYYIYYICCPDANLSFIYFYPKDSLQKSLFFDIFRRNLHCLSDERTKKLFFRYAETLEQNDKDIVHNILGNETLVDFRFVSDECKKYINPLQSYNVEHSFYLPFFMCFTVAKDDFCCYCGHPLKNLKSYFSSKIEYFTKIVQEIDIYKKSENLFHSIRHKINSNEKVLKSLLNMLLYSKGKEYPIIKKKNIGKQSSGINEKIVDFNVLGISDDTSKNMENQYKSLINDPNTNMNFDSCYNTKYAINPTSMDINTGMSYMNELNSLVKPNNENIDGNKIEDKNKAANLSQIELVKLFKYFDTTDPKIEEMILDTLKIILNRDKPTLLVITIHILNNTKLTSKITFGIFSIFYSVFKRSVNDFEHLKIRSEIFKHEKEFSKIKNFIFEAIKDVTTLSNMFSAQVEMFIEENAKYMLFYSGFELSDKQILHNIPHYIARQSKLEGMVLGYDMMDIVDEYGPRIISAMLCEHNFDLGMLSPYIKNVYGYIKNNFFAILFDIKSLYESEDCKCIFPILKYLVDINNTCIRIIIPFLEYFIEKEKSGSDSFCDDILSLIDNDDKCLLLPYLSDEKFVDVVLSSEFIEDDKSSRSIVERRNNKRSGFKNQKNKIGINNETENIKNISSFDISLHVSTSNSNNIPSKFTVSDILKMGEALLFCESKHANKMGVIKFGRLFKNYISTGNVFKQGDINGTDATISYFKLIKNKDISYLIYNYVDLCFFVEHYDFDLLALIGDTWQPQQNIPLEFERSTIPTMCNFLLNNVLCHSNVSNQDYYFFAIQETLKYINDTELVSDTPESILRFRNTRYFIPIQTEFILNNEKNQKFNDFVKYLLNLLVFLFSEIKSQIADILRLGTVLESSAIQDYVCCGIELLPENCIEKFKSSINLDQCKQSINFLLQLQLTKDIFNNECCVLLASRIENPYFLIYFLEKSGIITADMIKAYYAIGDYVSVKAACAESSIVDSNIFLYGFLVDRDCKSMKEDYNISQKNCSRISNIDFDEIIKENGRSVEEKMKSIRIAGDLKIKDENVVMIRILNTSKLDFEAYNCKLGSNENTTQINNFIGDSNELTTDLKNVGAYELNEHFTRVNNNSKINLKNNSVLEHKENYSNKNDQVVVFSEKFKIMIKKLKLRYMRENQEYNKALVEITHLLFNREWYALYEYAKILQCLNRRTEAKSAIKKLIAMTYEAPEEKSLVLQAILENRKSSYESALYKIKKNEKLYFYYAKYLQDIEPARAVECYCRSIIYGTKYHNQSIPLLLHLFSEKENKPCFYRDTKPLMQNLFKNSSSNYFVPFINQILPKITHAKEEVFEVISTLLIILLNKHTYLFWNAMIFINGLSETAKKILIIIDMLMFDSKLILKDTKMMCKFFVDVCGMKNGNGIKGMFPKIGKVVVPISITVSTIDDNFIEEFYEKNECGNNESIIGKKYSTHKEIEIGDNNIYMNGELYKNGNDIIKADKLGITKHKQANGNTEIFNGCSSSNNISNRQNINTKLDNPQIRRNNADKHIENLYKRRNHIYNSYVNNDVYIEDIDEEVIVFNSLQSPKRIGLICSDGKTYLFLCKPNDDLRKDSRFMDLIGLLNSVLKEHKIKSYNVVPITHKHGLIEWISNLKSYKSIIYKLYNKININPSNTTQKYRAKKKLGSVDFAKVVSEYPPVFHNWLKLNYTNPIDWFMKRKIYTSTYSVMCCVGWFLGLGDRHGENIMFGSCGETVHVDLNCLFEKGKKFEVPERVPFRLTQNIVDAFGILKTKGHFTHVFCETLKIIQNNKELIFSNLLSFVYDPLWEWNKRICAQQVLSLLENKICCEDVGIKCEDLVEEATKDDNLANMYIGWTSFL